MRKEFFDRAIGQFPTETGGKKSIIEMEKLFSRFDLICAKNPELSYSTLIESGIWTFQVKQTSPEQNGEVCVRMQGNGFWQFRGSLDGKQGFDTGSLSTGQAKILLVNAVAELYPIRAREGMRNFLLGNQDSVQVDGKVVARIPQSQSATLSSAAPKL